MVAKPRVCIFTETYFPVVGGGETQARLLAEGLASRGVPVIIVTRRSDPSLARVERYGDITVYRLPPTGRHHLNKWGLLLFSFPALLKLRRQYDAIFVSGYRVLGVPAVLVSKLLHKPCILKADNNGEMSGRFFNAGLAKVGLSPDSLLFKTMLWLRNRILRSATCFVAMSSDIAGELAANRVEPLRVHSIPNCVDTEAFSPASRDDKTILRRKLAIPEKGIVVIYTGRLVSYKGLPVLLRAWTQISVRFSNAVLLLVGPGSDDIHNCEEELRRYVCASGLQRSVIFAGAVPKVSEYLQASDIYVFPTKMEAFGLSLLEAMACGLPVVSTPVGGIKDVLVHGQNGLLVDVDNVQQLCEALNALMSDSRLAMRLGVAARQTVRDRFSAEAIVEKYVELFQRVDKVGSSPRKLSGESRAMPLTAQSPYESWRAEKHTYADKSDMH
jgi:glycosyltransferase involved in cell wall biosynthesis